MKIHARILVMTAAGCLLAANAAQAQSQPPAPALDHPGYITQAPGPQLPPPMPDAGSFSDEGPMPSPQPMPNAPPMPGNGTMPVPGPTYNTHPVPYTNPMPGGGMPPNMMPMPNSMPMPGAAPCQSCGSQPAGMPGPGYGPMPYGMPGPNQGMMPPGGTMAGAQLPPGAFPYIPPRIIHYGWPGLRIYRRDVPMPQPKPDPTHRETKFVHPRSARLEIRTVPPARIYVDGEELDCIDGVYLVEPPKPLLPGVTYMHSVRVEGFDPQGKEIARTVVVYLRKGRVTELTFY